MKSPPKAKKDTRINDLALLEGLFILPPPYRDLIEAFRDLIETLSRGCSWSVFTLFLAWHRVNHP